ncbi:hypothetical protein [Clostridium sp.]|uniref:hypothetical protein n=1 Tax=Clostridium sp. TaxID=1506 RepID=UPI003D6C9596
MYGRKYNGLYGYDREELLKMIDKIEKYYAEYYVISHEPVCDRKEISDFWELLRTTAQIACEVTSAKHAIRLFMNKFNREPSENEKSYIEGFINANKA